MEARAWGTKCGPNSVGSGGGSYSGWAGGRRTHACPGALRQGCPHSGRAEPPSGQGGACPEARSPQGWRRAVGQGPGRRPRSQALQHTFWAGVQQGPPLLGLPATNGLWERAGGPRRLEASVSGFLPRSRSSLPLALASLQATKPVCACLKNLLSEAMISGSGEDRLAPAPDP